MDKLEWKISTNKWGRWNVEDYARTARIVSGCGRAYFHAMPAVVRKGRGETSSKADKADTGQKSMLSNGMNVAGEKLASRNALCPFALGDDRRRAGHGPFQCECGPRRCPLGR